MSFSMNDVSDQGGRLAIVTGANTGLGYETAKAMAAAGMFVVMACRSADRAETAKQAILAEVPSAQLEILQVDLTSLASVRNAAEAFRAQHAKLDVLVNNAGIMVPPYSKTEDGFESQMGANCFGHFLFTSLLLDLIPDAPESRVVWLSSIAHKPGKIDFDDINFEQGYNRQKAYSQSKIACLMYCFEMDRKFKAQGKQIRSTASHPGAASETELMRNTPKWLEVLFNVLFKPFISHSNASGAMPSLEAALSPTAEGGQYFGPQGFMEMRGPSGLAKIASQAHDAEVAAKLWDVSEQLTGAKYSF